MTLLGLLDQWRGRKTNFYAVLGSLGQGLNSEKGLVAFLLQPQLSKCRAASAPTVSVLGEIQVSGRPSESVHGDSARQERNFKKRLSLATSRSQTSISALVEFIAS